MPKKIIYFLPILLVLGLFIYKSYEAHKTNVSNQISISGKTLSVEIANTTQEREQGLSDRESLCSNCGLLFIFDQPGIYPFWMKRMHFDIDILWLKDNKVIDITFNAQRPAKEDFENPKEIFQSKTEIDKVLEVNAGWTERNGINIGDEILFKEGDR